MQKPIVAANNPEISVPERANTAVSVVMSVVMSVVVEDIEKSKYALEP